MSEKLKNCLMTSQVSVGRNIESCFFPEKLTMEQREESAEKLERALSGTQELQGFLRTNEEEMDSTVFFKTARRGLLSAPTLPEPFQFLFYNMEKEQAIRVNDGDHITVTSCSKSGNLARMGEEVLYTTGLLEKSIPFSFDEKLGYLTESISAMGSGCTGLVLLHLPAHFRTENLKKLQERARIGGFSAEMPNVCIASRMMGEMICLRNRNASVLTPDEMLEALRGFAESVIQEEENLRNDLIEKKKIIQHDRIFRSLGVLSCARRLSEQEFAQRWSDLRFGAMADIFPLSTDILDRFYCEMVYYRTHPTRRGIILEEKPKDEILEERAAVVRSWMRKLTAAEE